MPDEALKLRIAKRSSSAEAAETAIVVEGASESFRAIENDDQRPRARGATRLDVARVLDDEMVADLDALERLRMGLRVEIRDEERWPSAGQRAVSLSFSHDEAAW